MSEYDHNPNLNFPRTLRTVYARFQEYSKHSGFNEGLILQQDGIKFLGVSTAQERCFDPHAFRAAIGKLLCLNRFRIVQVVGDCAYKFTSTACLLARSVLQSLLMGDDHAGEIPAILEYGYTASEHDANWVVNDLIASMPQLSGRTIANTVYMSTTAVESWGYEASGNIQNMVLAYSDLRNTQFGDDVWLSDSIMSGSKGDILVCLEGGPQAFAQAASVCVAGSPVIAMSGNMRVSATSQDFSAAYMLRILRGHFEECVNKRNITDMEKNKTSAEAIKYLDSCMAPGSSIECSKYDLVAKSLSTLVWNLENLINVQVICAD